jgi:anion-transporting  ArsA/GET3 family ATPase
MPNYYNAKYNIITIGEYLNNLLSYQFSGTLEISDKDYINNIQKDFLKDFYCSMIDQEIEPKLGENLLDKFEDYNSPFDYIIIDRDSIQSFLDSYEIMVWFVLDLGEYLDIVEYDKFNFIHSIIRVENMDCVIKLERVARNIKLHPVYIEELENEFDYIEQYNYDDLIL